MDTGEPAAPRAAGRAMSSDAWAVLALTLVALCVRLTGVGALLPHLGEPDTLLV